MTDPSEVLKIGQKVEAQVINIDIDERRIGLSIKALLPIDKETMERIKKEQAEEEAKKNTSTKLSAGEAEAAKKTAKKGTEETEDSDDSGEKKSSESSVASDSSESL